LRDGGWIDTVKAHPNSDALHVTERFRRTDLGHIDLAITIDDPKPYLKPWTVKTQLSLHPDTELIEAFCDDHERTMQHRAAARAAQRRGSVIPWIDQPQTAILKVPGIPRR
jgi:hypothetical protein